MSDSEFKIIEYLSVNREAFRESQFDLLQKKKTLIAAESIVFHSDIQNQCDEQIKSRITLEICDRLALDFETVFGVVEDLDLVKYLSDIG